MKLKLRNFGCHRFKELELPDTGLTLLSGESGRGKSTILRAIGYAILGKERTPYTFGAKSCSVEIKWTLPSGVHLKILRESQPKRLVVEVDDSTYEDKEAQNILENLLHISETTYKIAAYCAQGTNASLLSSPSQDQLSFLQSLSGTESAETIRGKITEFLREHQFILKTLMSEMETLDADRNHILAMGGIPEDELPVLTHTDIDELRGMVLATQNEARRYKSKLDDAKRLLQQFEVKLTEHQELVANKKKLERELFVLREQLPEEPDAESIANLIADVKKLQLTKHRQMEKDAELLRLQEVEAMIESHFMDLRNQIAELSKFVIDEEEDEEYEEHDDVTKEETEEARVSYQEIIAHILESKRLMKSLNVVEDTTPEVLFETLQELNQENLHKCPFCGEFVSVTDVLKKPTGKVPSEENQRIYFALYMQLSSLMPLLFPNTKSSIISASRKNKEKIVELEHDIEMKNIPFHLQQCRDDVVRRLAKYDVSSEEITDESLEAKTNTIRKLRDQQMLYTTSTSRISEISKMLETCVNLPSEKEHAKLKTLVMNLAEETTEKVDEHSDLVTRLNDAEKLERAYKLSHHLAQKTKLLKETEHKMKQSQNLIRGAESLQTIAVKAELTTLNHTIRVLNDTAAIYLSEMFDDPIDIRFSTTKELKSGKEKAQVAVKCCYKGSVYDNIEQLSGGERQRANLAFLLAVCQMVGTPILLLDECLNSLDGETHLSIVDHIKRFSMEHLVIVVSHEAIEGKFDNNVIYL